MSDFTNTIIWGIHAGKTGDADSLFLKKNCIALGWAKMGDLSILKPDRDAFKSRVVKAYPDAKPGVIPNNAGQLFRFVHEMKPGDWVVYPSKRDRQIHLGCVEGGYRYDPKTEPGYPNVRTVKWQRAVPRTQFSQGALYEIGAAMSLFLVKNYADEYRAAVEGKAASIVSVAHLIHVTKGCYRYVGYMCRRRLRVMMSNLEPRRVGTFCAHADSTF